MEEHRLQNERVLARIARRWSAWNRTVRDRPVGPTLSEQELAERLSTYDFEQPRGLEEMVEDVADLLEQGGLHATHPRYFGLFVPSVSGAGVAGDALAAVYNPQLAAWWHAPAAAHIERQTLAFFRTRIGLPESAFACFTTVAMAHLLRNALPASGWKVMNGTDLPVVCFCDEGGRSSWTTALVRSVIEEGLTWISEVRLPDGQRWLRACITHADAGPTDVWALVDALERARARLTPEAAEHA